jgi:hypothetical protein
MVELRENFCPACVSVPIALAAGLMSGGKTQDPGNYRKVKNISFTISMLIIFVSLGIGIYNFFIKKCSLCVGE